MIKGFENQKDLTDYLIDSRALKSPEIIEVFETVDRKDFVAPENVKYAYYDGALPIGYNQTISQPTTVGIMFELLQPKKGQKILDIGSGSGWTTAMLGYIVGREGSVIGLELVPELVAFGQQNLSKYDFPQAQIQQAGDSLGLPGQLFDRILVSAAANRIPAELVDQLKLGGRMVIPVENSIMLVKRDLTGSVNQKEIPGFVFVPLIS